MTRRKEPKRQSLKATKTIKVFKGYLPCPVGGGALKKAQVSDGETD